MRLNTIKISALFLILFMSIGVLPTPSSAQTLPVKGFRTKQVRIQQLFNDSLSISLSNRPIWIHTYKQYFKGHEDAQSWWNRPHSFLHTVELKDRFMGGGLKLGVFEPVLSTTFNSKFPYNGGGNNGAAWYGRGFTTELRGGVFLTSNYLTITFRPHVIFTQNKAFKVPRFVPRDDDGNVLYGHPELGFGIDAPFRFGSDAFTKFSLAQSSIRLHYKSIEAGLSTAPLWWGPGIHNALVLSNNAPGLQHVFLGTRRPLQLPLNIGQIEFKFIGAWPQDSDYFRYTQSTNRRRFMSGFNVVYTPSFAPHLHVGYSSIVHIYVPESGLAFADYLRSINIFNRQVGESDVQNQLVSAYFRWVFPEGHAEVYGAYYREDSFQSARDLILEPGHDRAYTIGLQKIIPTTWIDFVKVNLEISSLVPNRLDEVRHQTYYYTHGIIRQGHTNEGQILGAAIGTGSGSQYLGVEGYFDKGMAGFFIQRVADNDFFHFEFNDRFVFPLKSGTKDYFNHQIDLHIGLKGKYKFENILLGARLIWTKAYNYGRYELGNRAGPDIVEPNEDLVNWQLGLSIRYLF